MEFTPDRHGYVSPHDPAYLAGVLLDHWLGFFDEELGAENLKHVHRFLDLRNRWAHHKPFDAESIRDGIDTCRQLLLAIGSAYVRDLVLTEQPMSMRKHRRAASSVFRQEQWERRFDPHVHHADVIVLQGDSYRLKDRTKEVTPQKSR